METASCSKKITSSALPDTEPYRPNGSALENQIGSILL
jgi:hypothetical protein